LDSYNKLGVQLGVVSTRGAAFIEPVKSNTMQSWSFI